MWMCKYSYSWVYFVCMWFVYALVWKNGIVQIPELKLLINQSINHIHSPYVIFGSKSWLYQYNTNEIFLHGDRDNGSIFACNNRLVSRAIPSSLLY